MDIRRRAGPSEPYRLPTISPERSIVSRLGSVRGAGELMAYGLALGEGWGVGLEPGDDLGAVVDAVEAGHLLDAGGARDVDLGELATDEIDADEVEAVA